MTQIISVKDYEKDVNIIERLQREMEGRQSILACLVDMGCKDSSTFKEYFEEFLQYKTAFEISKSNFLKEKIQPMFNDPIKSWELSYDDKEMTINV